LTSQGIGLRPNAFFFGGLGDRPLANSTKGGQAASRGGPAQQASALIARKGDLPDPIVQAGLTDRDLSDATDPQSQTGYEVNAVRLEADGDRDSAQDMIQQGLARYPDSENLRYEYIQPWLTRLARGTATKEVTAQAGKLTHSADAVVRGTVLASQHRWEELRTLDDSLAEATWRDPWKLDAVLLQVQWRCQDEADATTRRQRGDEALALIDQAVSAQPAIVLYAMRVQSALTARRSNVVVESIWEYGHGLFSDSSLEPAQIRAALEELLQVLSQQTGADRLRVQEVRQRLLNDIRGLTQ